MLARQIRAITARTSAAAVKCANVANTRRESLRKLAELRPLPVIKSKEGRRYAEYAERPWSETMVEKSAMFGRRVRDCWTLRKTGFAKLIKWSTVMLGKLGILCSRRHTHPRESLKLGDEMKKIGESPALDDQRRSS
ncbi:hypothetical protein K0M31_012517 [Melipona bicolor]|uniref:Uncharacterized protein n=1 Tax=Melipona bicolor TaxID=60889 RepID=A0AA40FKW1_9HYME|nr:hypothetical protein K0M31_012517 [Melipona bicolor]